MRAQREASFYETLASNRARCTLCPHNCRIADGGRGACGVRGKLHTLVYDKVVARNLEPIEKSLGLMSYTADVLAVILSDLARVARSQVAIAALVGGIAGQLGRRWIDFGATPQSRDLAESPEPFPG